MTEREKMQKGEWYDANFDPELLRRRNEADHLCWMFNTSDPKDTAGRGNILRMLLGVETLPEGLQLLSPVYFDYGSNVRFGKGCQINHGCYFMDGAVITIGENAFIGPNCGFYTAAHPLDFAERNRGFEKASPITVGDNCWLGAGVQVMPGVTVGNGCVIAAGSVVTKDVRANTLSGGIPAREIRKIDQSERVVK